MAFKSEIHVAELASIRTGHTEGDIYYILDNGMLGDLPCKPGDFVKWHNDDWQIQPDEHYALASAVDGEIAEAIDNVLDDGSTSESIVVAVPSSQSDDYTVGNYYEVQGKVARLRTKTDGDNVTQLTFDTTSGVLEAMNNIAGEIAKVKILYGSSGNPPAITFTDMIATISKGYYVILDIDDTFYPFIGSDNFKPMFSNGTDKYTLDLLNTWTKTDFAAIGSVKNGGSVAQSDGYVSVENNSLTTITGVNVAALEVSVSFGNGSTEVPNFALEIDPTVDCTLTLKRYIGSSPLTLTPSVAGGNEMTAGKHYQVTCVGSCWTLAEFAMPS